MKVTGLFSKLSLYQRQYVNKCGTILQRSALHQYISHLILLFSVTGGVLEDSHDNFVF